MGCRNGHSVSCFPAARARAAIDARRRARQLRFRSLDEAIFRLLRTKLACECVRGNGGQSWLQSHWRALRRTLIWFSGSSRAGGRSSESRSPEDHDAILQISRPLADGSNMPQDHDRLMELVGKAQGAGAIIHDPAPWRLAVISDTSKDFAGQAPCEGLPPGGAWRVKLVPFSGGKSGHLQRRRAVSPKESKLQGTIQASGRLGSPGYNSGSAGSGPCLAEPAATNSGPPAPGTAAGRARAVQSPPVHVEPSVGAPLRIGVITVPGPTSRRSPTMS